MTAQPLNILSEIFKLLISTGIKTPNPLFFNVINIHCYLSLLCSLGVHFYANIVHLKRVGFK